VTAADLFAPDGSRGGAAEVYVAEASEVHDADRASRLRGASSMITCIEPIISPDGLTAKAGFQLDGRRWRQPGGLQNVAGEPV
jgi:hypothetical protein